MVAPNDILGYYRLIEKIGAGGMGEVWKAEDTRLGRIVAVKILPPEVASDQEAIARMRREARTAAQINSPNIATIYSFEEIGERLFIVMEYVEGEPLSKVMKRGPIPEADLCRIGRDVAEALGEAHAKGIIHRDIKPDNIIVSGKRVKVLDFGIAKQLTVTAGSDDPTAYMTQAGIIIGTVNYMSPEQALGKTLDARTDIFSLGIVLYQAATGTLPFKGETATETITKIVRDDPADPGMINKTLSPNFTRILARCLRKPREQRFGSAADLAQALENQMAKASTSPMTSAAGAGGATREPPVLVASPAPAAPLKKSSSSTSIFVVVIAIALLAAAVLVIRSRRHAPRPANTTPAVAATSAPAPTQTSGAVAPASAVESTAPAPSPNAFGDALNDLREGRESEARLKFMAAIAADPQNRKARLGLAITNHNWPHARQIAREIDQQDPNDPDIAALRQLIKAEQKEQRGEPRRRFPH